MTRHLLPPPPWTTAERQRLREEALIEAEALRHQAIDDFWRGANAALATGATHALRASTRLWSRLRRRRAAMEA